MINSDFFKDINTEEKAYWLGFFYADGWIVKKQHNGNYSIAIKLSIKDDEHLEKFANIFNKNLTYHTHICSLSKYQTECYSAMIQLTSKEMWLDLQNKGITSDKTHQEDAKIFDYIPSELMHHFVRGFFDGDGCITKNLKKNSVYRLNFAGTYNFLIKLQEVIKSFIDININKVLKHENIYSLQWAGIGQLQEIYKWIYKDATIYLERKKAIFDEFSDIVPQSKQFGSNLPAKNAKYKGIFQRPNLTWCTRVEILGSKYNGGTYKDDFDAACKHDLIQVKIRGKEALKFMNFPQYYDGFVDLVNNNSTL